MSKTDPIPTIHIQSLSTHVKAKRFYTIKDGKATLYGTWSKKELQKLIDKL